MPPEHPAIEALARALMPPDQLARLRNVAFRDAGHGYDVFGLHPGWVGFAAGLTRFLYERWFRVSSHDAHHLPANGGAILAANHSGTLPLDGMMIWNDVVRHTDPPRVPRVILDFFVPMMPFVSTFFTRAGAIGGSRGNLESLLRDGELVLLFPEGTEGIGKPFRDRYQLQEWRVGHAEMAIRHGVPVVPIAVIGAEEQMPQVARIDRIHAFGSPYLPVPATLVPLPVHYHLWYGAPIPVAERFPPDRADDPDAVQALADEVRQAVEALIARGLAERKGIFR